MGRLAHPQQARPGGALGLSRGAGPGRGCGARSGGRRAARAQLLAITLPTLTNSSPAPAPSTAAHRCACFPLPLLSLLAGQVCVFKNDGGRCPCTKRGDGCVCDEGHEHYTAGSAGGEFRDAQLQTMAMRRPPRTSSAGPARGSPRAFSWCRAGPRVWRARRRATRSACAPPRHRLARAHRLLTRPRPLACCASLRLLPAPSPLSSRRPGLRLQRR